MILAQLKDRTRAQHERAEAALNLLDPGLTPERYRDVLRALYALYAPLCAQIEPWLGTHEALHWTARRDAKLLALTRDLRALDATLPTPRALPPMPGEAHAWGALYVLEGATLGGQVLRRHLAGRVGEAALAFFSSYGAQVGSRWKAFGAALEARAEQAGPPFERGVLSGAATTFTLFEALAAPERTRVGA